MIPIPGRGTFLFLPAGDDVDLDIDNVVFVSETSLTVRGSRRRTTIPKEIVDRLSLNDKGRIRWFLMRDGTIIVRKVKEERQVAREPGK